MNNANVAEPQSDASIALSLAASEYAQRERAEYTADAIIVGPDTDRIVLTRYLRRQGNDMVEAKYKSISALESRYICMVTKNKLSGVTFIMAADAELTDYLPFMGLLDKIALRKRFGLRYVMSPCTFEELRAAMVERGTTPDEVNK